jgi:hypothetical protein
LSHNNFRVVFLATASVVVALASDGGSPAYRNRGALLDYCAARLLRCSTTALLDYNVRLTYWSQ